ncbi:LPXTG cell wall anchor domain-containing protein, partial [Thomasclavelia sp.]
VNPANPPVENTANNPGNTVKAGDTTVKATKTGDDALIGVFAGIAMLSIAGLSVLRKKED